NSTQCLNFPAEGNPIIGTPVRIHQCDPFKDQQWNLADNQISNSGSICLTVKDDATADGTAVVYAPCRGLPGQHWTPDANGHIVGLGGKCLDVEGGDAVNWAPLIIATCTGTSTQTWRVQRRRVTGGIPPPGGGLCGLSGPPPPPLRGGSACPSPPSPRPRSRRAAP